MSMPQPQNVIPFGPISTATATTDFAVPIPVASSRGYTVRRVVCYDAQGGSSASATLSVRGSPGGAGTSVVADAPLTTHTAANVVSDRTVAATGVTPAVVDPILYVRIGTASGVAGTSIRGYFVIEPLP
jgi:hypothetical protein